MILGGTNVIAAERCSDTRIVDYGDSIDEVLAKCGKPIEIINYYNIFNQLVGQEFKYNLGEGKFPRYFYFDERGKVIRMRTGKERQ